MTLLLKFQTCLGLAFLLTVTLSPFFLKDIYYPPIQKDDALKKQQCVIHLNPSMELQGGRISIGIYLSNVEDICIWQTKLVYDPNLLVILEVEAGDFLSAKTAVINSTRLFYNDEPIEAYINTTTFNEQAILVYATDIAPGVLLIGGCNLNLHTISGSGKVAIITFGVYRPVDHIVVFLEESLFLDKDLIETARGSITVVGDSPHL